MSKLIIIGEGERYSGVVYGKYKINLDILSEIDDTEQIRDEIILLTNERRLSPSTVDLLFKIAHELENYEEVIK